MIKKIILVIIIFLSQWNIILIKIFHWSEKIMVTNNYFFELINYNWRKCFTWDKKSFCREFQETETEKQHFNIHILKLNFSFKCTCHLDLITVWCSIWEAVEDMHFRSLVRHSVAYHDGIRAGSVVVTSYLTWIPRGRRNGTRFRNYLTSTRRYDRIAWARSPRIDLTSYRLEYWIIHVSSRSLRV